MKLRYSIPAVLIIISAFSFSYFYEPQPISADDLFDCSSPISAAGTYVLQNNISGDCTILASGVILDGQDQYSISGNIIANGDSEGVSGYGVTVTGLTVSGAINSNGADSFSGTPGNGGTIYVYSGSTVTGGISASGGYDQSGGNTGGAGGAITVNDSTVTGNVLASGSSSGTTGGSGGVINATNSTLNITSGALTVAPGTGTNSPGVTGSITFSSATLVSGANNHTSSASFNGANVTQISGDFVYANGNVSFTSEYVFPGNVSHCGRMLSSGTYTLTQSIAAAPCFEVDGGTVVIDGQGLYTITGNINGQGDSDNLSGRSITLQNIRVLGTVNVSGTNDNNGNSGSTGSITLSSASTTALIANGHATYNANGTDFSPTAGGSITLVNSTSTTISAVGGEGNGSTVAGASGGAVTLTNSTIYFIDSNNAISVTGGNSDYVDGSPGQVSFNNVQLIGNGDATTTPATTFSYTGFGTSYVAAPFKYVDGNVFHSGEYYPQVMAKCGIFIGTGTYTLSQNVTGNCVLRADNVIIEGQGFTITGNVDGSGTSGNAGGRSYTLRNLTVTGYANSQGLTLSEGGGSGGSVTLSTSTVGSINVSGGGSSDAGTGAGSGGNVTLINRSVVTGTIYSRGGDANEGYAGSGGQVTITNSTVSGAIQTYGGTDNSGFYSNGGNGPLSLNDSGPIMTLGGSTPVNVAFGSTYTDAGATAYDIKDGSKTVDTSGSVDTNTLGSYVITYTATDGGTSISFNGGTESVGPTTSTTTRTVNVVAAAPTVTTGAASSVGETSATLGGEVTATNGANATALGFNYGTSISYSATSTTSGSFSAGTFSGTLTGLTCNTTYHYRAFATNSAGTAYGSDGTFTTSACPSGGAVGYSGGGFTSGGSVGIIYHNRPTTTQPQITNPALPTGTPAQSGVPGVNTGTNAGPRENPIDRNPDFRFSDFFKRDLTLKSVGQDVTLLQQFLNWYGYPVNRSGAGSDGYETNYFGPATKAALSRFQAANGIFPTAGYFGSITRAVIRSLGF